ncbi:phage tail protein I [Clostridium sp. KNHs216]|uniref:phage tail protein I n=1 Tax=Clostridium sp. KNHs216 TaxID=1550235 RepID=UPI001154CED1|nr:phage tail protein I [Clostridium sp. KNHs216]TQI66724.1 phage tail P2-like protein [Clostridium sp. KNHs216]
MVDLKNVDLLSMQSQRMQQDRTTQALSAALTPILQELGEEVIAVILYPYLDSLSGAVLDELAWGLHVDVYDALASDEEKRQMIRNSYLIHKYKGTVFAVRKIVESVFGEAGKIEEWFQYSGDPYHFRMDVYCQSKGVTAAEQIRALQLVEAGKNLRSELDGIRLILSQTVNARVAAVTSVGSVIDVYPIGEMDTHKVKIATAAIQTTVVDVYALEG